MKARPRSRKKAAIVAGVILGIFVLIYVVGVAVFSTHTYPRTTLSGTDLSLKSTSALADEVENISNNYAVSVSGDGLNFKISSLEAGMKVNGTSIAQQAIGDNQAWKWPVEVFRSHDITSYLVSEYNSNGLESAVKKEVDAFNATAKDPVNATITYSSTAKAFSITPEVAGTKVDVNQVLKLADDAILSMDSTVSLNSAQLVQPTVLSDNPALKTACDTANSYIKANLELVLGTTAIHAATINADQISQWVTLGADNSVTFNEDAMNSYISDLANSLNTVGSSRTYTTPYGKAVTVSGGTYGWEIDNDTLVSDVEEAIKAGSTATITVPTTSEGATWTGAGVKDWGAYVDVDLTEQHARFYDASGALQWETDVVTGIPDGSHNTPVGVWQLFNKESPSVLKGDIVASTGAPEYTTTVQYWMPFTYSGCGLHDAPWQSSFGGSRYSSGYGSHGCVNLSMDAAASLYNLVAVGNAVVVHD